MPQILNDAPHPFKGTEIHTLANGLTLILRQDATVPVVALQAWTRCGAIDEKPSQYGISHGLEHMVFKGTPTRSAGQISRTVEANGGSMNAATQLETTHYYIDIPSYSVKPAIDVLADTLLNPTFPQEELERERLVILEEIHRRDDSPDATLWDEFASQVFKNTPYGIKVIGSIDTVSAMSRNDLMTYFHAHYVPSKMTMVVAGDFNKKAVLKQLTDHFEKLPFKKPPETPTVDTRFIGNPTRNILKKPVQLNYFGVGFPTVGYGNPDVVALDLLADVLGGGVSARLYQKLREKTEIVLSIGCDYIPFQQCGLFALFGETTPDKAQEALWRMAEEIDRISEEPVQMAELNRAKARMKSGWLHGSETPHGQANTLGSLHVLGQMDLLSTYLAQIDASTPEDLMEVYKRHIKGKTFFSTMVEPNS
ncbi:MAG: putative zinc protease [Elusimicrobia bacterium]|nr:putative zinc protease [Elusimicrobiota bacterium]